MADKFLGPTGLARLIAHIKTALKEIQENSGASGDYVPTSRKVNEHALSEDVTLTAADVGAAKAQHTHTAADVGALAKGEALEFGGSKGEAGQVLTSQGDAAAPVWKDAVGRSTTGQTLKTTDENTTVEAAEGAEIFNDYRERSFSMGNPANGNVATGLYSHAEGNGTTATGRCSHAEGGGPSCATGNWSHSEGQSYALGSHSHAEGIFTKASGDYSHAEGGSSTTASGRSSHAEGGNTTAEGDYSHAEGNACKAKGNYSHAGGSNTIANNCQTAIGEYNVEKSTKTDGYLIVGAGSGDSSRKNAFRVSSEAVYGGQYNAEGADYAELFEWQDGNPDGEDRAGKFVALDGEKVHLCGTDEKPLGIISAVPAVIGDSYDDQWHGMYQTDVFGRLKYEMQTVPAVTDEEGNDIIPEHQELLPVLNPEYDNTQEYIPRSKRSEWAAVGFIGKFVVVDDGTCEPNGYCKPSDGGVATESEAETPYRVMARIDGTHIRVLALPIV